jgi:hypothetical protein
MLVIGTAPAASEEISMITMPYATVMAAIIGAAALGATTAAWVLCGALVENRVLVTRAQRWQSRMSHPSIPVLSTVDVLFARTATAIMLRRNEVRVRLALRRTERLLRRSRRMHVGMHRLDASVQQAQHRFAGMAAGWLPTSTMERQPVLTGTVVAANPTLTVSRTARVQAILALPAAPAAALEAAPVVETSPQAYRPIRTHRPTASRRPAPRPTGSRPSVPRQRGARSSSRAHDFAVA